MRHHLECSAQVLIPYPSLRVLSTAAIVILGAAYGLDIPTKDDSHVLEAEAAVGVVVAVSMPGNYLVNVLPVLKYVPAWFPGAYLKWHLDMRQSRILI